MSSFSEARDQIVLDLFNRQDPEQPALYVNKISELTGLSKSSAKRSVRRLVSTGLLTDIGGFASDPRHYYVATSMVSEMSGPPRNAYDQRILDLLKNQSAEDPWIDFQEIISSTCFDKKTVRDCFKRLEPAGELKVQKVAHRYYYAHPSLVREGTSRRVWTASEQKLIDLFESQSVDSLWLDFQEIVKAMNLSKTPVQRCLDRLEAEGVVRVEKGRKKKLYALASKVFQSRPPRDSTANEQLILDLLRKQDPKNPWVDTDQISSKTGLNLHTAKNCLPKLVSAGELKVQKVRHKNYYAHVSLAREDSRPQAWNQNEQQILDLLRNQDPRDPWVDMDQISSKTGLNLSTVESYLPGLVSAEELQVQKVRYKNYYAHVSLVTESSRPRASVVNEQRVVNLLASQSAKNPWLDLQQIMSAVKQSKETVNRCLKSLEASGLVKVETVSRGKKLYALASKVSQIGSPREWTANKKQIVGLFERQREPNLWLGVYPVMQGTGLSRGIVAKALRSLKAEGVLEVRKEDRKLTYVLVIGQRILNLVYSSTEPLTVSQISSDLHLPQGVVVYHLGKHVDSGVLRESVVRGRHYYTLSSFKEETPEDPTEVLVNTIFQELLRAQKSGDPWRTSDRISNQDQTIKILTWMQGKKQQLVQTTEVRGDTYYKLTQLGIQEAVRRLQQR